MNSPAAYANPYTVADAEPSARVAFIRRTYLHVAGAIGAFALFEAFLLSQPWAGNLASMMQGKAWLVVLGLFMVVSWLAEKWSHSDTSRGVQYLGLGLYTVAMGVLTMPLLMMAQAAVGDNSMILKAGMVTMLLFAGLTAAAFLTGKDFSFLRSFLIVASFIALGLIIAGTLFGFNLGLWFSAAMVLIASISILYNTSNIIHHYRTDQHVGASLALFSSVALLFWYVLRLFLSRD